MITNRFCEKDNTTDSFKLETSFIHPTGEILNKTQSTSIFKQLLVDESDSFKNPNIHTPKVFNTNDYFTSIGYFKKQKNIGTIHSFADLARGWNGYDAPPFDATLLNHCIKLIKILEPRFQPDVFPTARNSIQFEYEDKHGRYLEIEIFEDHYEYFYENLNGREAESKLANWDEIFELIYEYYITTPH